MFVCIPWLQANGGLDSAKRAKQNRAWWTCTSHIRWLQANGGLDCAKRAKENVPGGLVYQVHKQINLALHI